MNISQATENVVETVIDKLKQRYAVLDKVGVSAPEPATTSIVVRHNNDGAFQSSFGGNAAATDAPQTNPYSRVPQTICAAHNSIERVEAAAKLHPKGYIPPQECSASSIAVEKAVRFLDEAKTTTFHVDSSAPTRPVGGAASSARVAEVPTHITIHRSSEERDANATSTVDVAVPDIDTSQSYKKRYDPEHMPTLQGQFQTLATNVEKTRYETASNANPHKYAPVPDPTSIEHAEDHQKETEEERRIRIRNEQLYGPTVPSDLGVSALVTEVKQSQFLRPVVSDAAFAKLDSTDSDIRRKMLVDNIMKEFGYIVSPAGEPVMLQSRKDGDGSVKEVTGADETVGASPIAKVQAHQSRISSPESKHSEKKSAKDVAKEEEKEKEPEPIAMEPPQPIQRPRSTDVSVEKPSPAEEYAADTSTAAKNIQLMTVYAPGAAGVAKVNELVPAARPNPPKRPGSTVRGVAPVATTRKLQRQRGGDLLHAALAEKGDGEGVGGFQRPAFSTHDIDVLISMKNVPLTLDERNAHFQFAERAFTHHVGNKDTTTPLCFDIPNIVRKTAMDHETEVRTVSQVMGEVSKHMTDFANTPEEVIEARVQHLVGKPVRSSSSSCGASRHHRGTEDSHMNNSRDGCTRLKKDNLFTYLEHPTRANKLLTHMSSKHRANSSCGPRNQTVIPCTVQRGRGRKIVYEAVPVSTR